MSGGSGRDSGRLGGRRELGWPTRLRRAAFFRVERGRILPFLAFEMPSGLFLAWRVISGLIVRRRRGAGGNSGNFSGRLSARRRNSEEFPRHPVIGVAAVALIVIDVVNGDVDAVDGQLEPAASAGRRKVRRDGLRWHRQNRQKGRRGSGAPTVGALIGSIRPVVIELVTGDESARIRRC